MIISDTHTHLYLKEFDSDRDQVINNAIQPLTIAISQFIFYKIEILGNSLPLIVFWLIANSIMLSFEIIPSLNSFIKESSIRIIRRCS